MLKTPYNNVYGTWKVSTEADCECWTAKTLGVFTGYLDEIALTLADKAFYRLCFKAVPTSDEAKVLRNNPTRNSVEVQLDIDSGTWDMTQSEIAHELGVIMKDRPVTVKASLPFATVYIISKKHNIAEFRKMKELEKLKMEERKNK